MRDAVKQLRQGKREAVHLIQLAKSEFSKSLKRYRTNRGWSLRAMGFKIGASAVYLSDIENGRRAPSDRFLQEVESLRNRNS